MSTLVIVRHGQTPWNAHTLLSGHTDIPLSALGILQAQAAGAALIDVPIHRAYSSRLRRAKHTLQLILEARGLPELHITEVAGLNERHFGIYEGWPIESARAEVGSEELHKIRRAWDHPIKGGETLKQTHERAIPYYEKHIRPKLQAGENIIIATHGNTMRVLAKYLENISEQDFPSLEIGNAQTNLYQIDEVTGYVLGKEIRRVPMETSQNSVVSG